MSDQRYLQDERLIIHIASVVGIAIAILAILSAIFFRERRAAYIPKEEVWAFIETEATAAGLVPEFVYAIAWAESSLNANAESSVARGMMQLTKIAWREVSAQPYRDAWDWQTNVRVAIDYLSYCRQILKGKKTFSYPLLAACYRYGPTRVIENEFDLSKLPKPSNAIYKAIFKGSVRPVPLP